MNRLPLRVRLTLAFALVMAVVLGLTGLFLYVRFRADLNGTIDGSLSSRSDAVSALVRESRGPLDDALARAGDLSLDPATQRVWRGEAEIALSPRELALLEVFMRRPGEVLSRLALLDGAWDQAYENRSNIIDVYVGYLREKIDRPFGMESLETVRGRGYRLREDGGG